MAKLKYLEDRTLLRILNQLPLRKVLCLRRVNRKWKKLIETEICMPKTSLKIFGSLKAVLDYYQFVNREYLEIKGPSVPLDRLLDGSSTGSASPEVRSPGSCNRTGCACRRPMRWELVRHFAIHLPGGAVHFPAFSLPSDDHLIVSRLTTRLANTLQTIFPNLESLVIFHVGSFNERYFRLPFSLPKLTRLEMYEVDSISSPLGSSETDWENMLVRRVPPRTQSPMEMITTTYRLIFGRALEHLEELSLDGAFIGKYFFWELLLEARDHLALKRLKISRFTEEQLMSKRAVTAMSNATALRNQLTHLTVDSVNFDRLDFLLTNFTQLQFLDVVVEQDALKGYDLLASLFNLRHLDELRLHSTDPLLFTPIQLNYIFHPDSGFPPVTKLHLYLVQLTAEKLDLLTRRVFPTVQQLVLDSGLLSCHCESDFLRRVFQSFYRSQPEQYERKFLLNSACSKCLSKLPESLPPTVQLYFYDGCHVIDTFFRLNQQLYSGQVRRLVQDARERDEEITQRPTEPVEEASLPATLASAHEPTSPRRRRPSMLQRIRNGLRRGIDRVSTRRHRATTTAALHSTLATLQMRVTTNNGFSNFDPDGPTDGEEEEAEDQVPFLSDNEMRALLRARDFEWREWLGRDEEAAEDRVGLLDDTASLSSGLSSASDDSDEELVDLLDGT